MINKNLVVENAKVVFRNFSGEERKFNRAGNRNFCIIFDKETGERLQEQGWNVSIMQPRDPDEEVVYKLQVTVSYNKIPPKIYLIAGRKKTLLNEDTVGNLDYAEIETSDIIIRPYNWEVSGKTGVKAYVDSMYVVIREDLFASKYDYVDDVFDGNEPF